MGWFRNTFPFYDLGHNLFRISNMSKLSTLPAIYREECNPTAVDAIANTFYEKILNSTPKKQLWRAEPVVKLNTGIILREDMSSI